MHGVSTRSVDDLVAAMGVQTGVSKSEVLNRPGNPGGSWPWKRGCRYVHGIVIGKEADQSQV